MKKIIAFLLSLFICITHVYASNPQEASTVKLYRADGKTKLVDKASLDDYLSDDWFLAPVVTIYKPNNKSSVVYKSDVDVHLANGWYLSPVVTIHRINNETSTVYKSDVDVHLSNGWYLAPVTKIFAKNGDSSTVYTKDVKTHLANGWYLSLQDIPKNEKAVALTYDDGPSKYTNKILDCLERFDAKATFFVLGNRVNSYADTLRRAHSLGMEIGNHSMTHPKLTSISLSSVASEINSTSYAIECITGKRPSLVRPPYGSYNQSVLSKAGLPFILWSIDTLDWKTRNAQKTVNAVLSKVSDGDIILMHDLYLPTAEATEIIVPRLVEMGYDLVTVSELAQRKGVTLTAKSYSKIK